MDWFYLPMVKMHTLLGWCKDNPQLFHSFEDVKDPDNNPYIFHPSKSGRQFVSPRSLEKASVFIERKSKMTDNALTCALAGTLGEAAAWFDGDANRLRGEFVLLVDGCEPAQVAADEEAFRVLGILLRELPLKQAVQLAVEISGRPRNALYGRALEMKKESC